MDQLDEANLRYAEAAVMDRRIKERRKRDRVTNFLTRAAVIALILFNIAGWKAIQQQQDEASDQRGALTSLVCTTLTRFIQSPPNYPRDKPALKDLSRECQQLQRKTEKEAR